MVFTIERSGRLPQLVAWAAFGGATAFFAAECIPRLRKDLYGKLPILGNYSVWQKYKDWSF
jgi:hypothetical protein